MKRQPHHLSIRYAPGRQPTHYAIQEPIVFTAMYVIKYLVLRSIIQTAVAVTKAHAGKHTRQNVQQLLSVGCVEGRGGGSWGGGESKNWLDNHIPSPR